MARKKPGRKKRSRRVKPLRRKSACLRRRRKVSRASAFRFRLKRAQQKIKRQQREIARLKKRHRRTPKQQKALRRRRQESITRREKESVLLREKNRMQAEVIKDLSRPTRRFFAGETEDEDEDEDEQPFVHVPGEKAVRIKGKIVGYSLPEILEFARIEMESFDFDSIDWDDLYESIGDEDEDSYEFET